MPFALAIEHLLLRLRPVRRALRAAVRRQTESARRSLRPGVSALCVTPEQVETLLDDLDDPSFGCGIAAEITTDEAARQQRLRARAAAAGCTLPLDRLARQLGLSAFEEEAILLCAAPEVDRGYERIVAYIHDDLNRRQPSVELVASLTASSLSERLTRIHLLGPHGRLRRYGLLDVMPSSTMAARQELRLTPSACVFLFGAGEGLADTFRDQAEVLPLALPVAPSPLPAETVTRIGEALTDRSLTAVGVWGARHAGRDEAVHAIAAASGWALRRLTVSGSDGADGQVASIVADATTTAAALRALLWVQIDVTGDLARSGREDIIAEALAASAAPLVLTAAQPWRPAALLEARSYAEVELSPPNGASRRRLWSAAFPEVAAERTAELASTFCLSGTEIRTIERIARMSAQLARNGFPAPLEPHVDAACRTVTQHRSAQLATLVQPRRGPHDLVLAGDLHRQVMDVAGFFRVRLHVEEGWGFSAAAGGIKALFTGEPGTGKTLAAEVIAGLLRVPLLKVDLARVVSKWVGETEKNLESVFGEAEESHCLLFFDEADALFGKRGEVQHGTDRYANLEVSYLLQKLEAYQGLVVLASNLHDQIDAAFTRRFHVTVHFPRPTVAERRRIWEIVFPRTAPLDPTVDLDVLARLDLTGAGIAAVAHTAALLAADAGALSIDVGRIVQAAVRQYRREARILTPSELGPYASVLKECL
jgi:hypothetical protein